MFRKGYRLSALAILGNAGAERDHLPVLEVLDREAVLLTRIPEMPLLSTAVDGRSPPSDPVNPL